MSFVYFIESTNGSTYIGATVNLDKRIRQHNKEIKGGARATSIKVEQGEVWKYICYVENFPNYNEALKFEWRWKQISRLIQKSNVTINPREKRFEALKKLLNLDKSTSKAIPYSEWEIKPNIVYSLK
jgi:predicted GIY-YIG superfamily endonuclease|tara:strand:+ start:461 stop:841 length:381 start_codon:yes stop_codon:yes gene_type:complete